VTDFLDVKRGEITERLKELAPLVDEYRRLEAAASALAGVGAAPRAASTTATAAAPRRKKGPGRPRGSGKKAASVAATTPAVASAGAATPTASTPTVPRKKVGRPRGSGKKVGRPPGSGKKVGRPATKKVGRPAGSTGTVGRPAVRPAARGGRRKGSGTRAGQALSFVQGQPGITIPELAAKMGIKQNYLYRVLPGLEQEGKLEKKGRGWHPKS
jgi:hypothetical protein